MKTIIRCLLLTVALVALTIPATVSAQDTAAQNDGRLRIDLTGFNEVIGPTLGIGTIFSTGRGRLTLKINKQIRSIDYELTYAFPDAAETLVSGAQFVNQAHFHAGQKHTTGSINVWLCQSADTPATQTEVRCLGFRHGGRDCRGLGTPECSWVWWCWSFRPLRCWCISSR